MAKVEITFPRANTRYIESERGLKGWQAILEVFPEELFVSGTSKRGRSLHTLIVWDDGQIETYFGNADNTSSGDLTPDAESGIGISFTFGGSTYTFVGIGDATEPYVWVPTNSADAIALYAAIEDSGTVVFEYPFPLEIGGARIDVAGAADVPADPVLVWSPLEIGGARIRVVGAADVPADSVLVWTPLEIGGARIKVVGAADVPADPVLVWTPLEIGGAGIDVAAAADVPGDPVLASNRVFLRTPLPASALDERPLDMKYQYLFSGLQAVKAKVTKVEPLEEDRFRIYAVDEDVEFYRAKLLALDTPLLDLGRARGPRILDMSVSDRLTRAGNVQVAEVCIRLEVSGNWVGGVIRASLDGGPEYEVARLTDGARDACWISQPRGTLRITAYPAGKGAPLTRIHHINDPLRPPGEVTGVMVDVLGDGTRRFRWTDPLDADLAGVKIRYTPSDVDDAWVDMTELHTGFLTSSPYESFEPPEGSYIFSFRACDTNGVLGPESRTAIIALGPVRSRAPTPEELTALLERTPGIFPIVITAAQQTLLENLAQGSSLPSVLQDLANGATPGDNLTYDSVRFIRGNFAQLWTWSGSAWVETQGFIAAENVFALEAFFNELIARQATINTLVANDAFITNLRANVNNVVVLWRNFANPKNFTVSGQIMAFSLRSTLTAALFDEIQGSARTRYTGYSFQKWSIPVAFVPIGTAGSKPSAATVNFSMATGDSPEAAHFFAWRSADGMTLYLQQSGSDSDARFYNVIGIKNPTGSGGTVAPTPGTSVQANAGANQSVASAGTAIIGGTDSITNGSGATTILWTRVSGTGGSLSSTSAAGPTFTAPTVTSNTTIVWRKTVTNNGVTGTDDVTITVTPPGATAVEANAGADQSVASAGTAIIGGADSITNPSGDTTILWTRVSGTGGSLSSTSAASPTFTAPTVTSERTIVWRKTVTNNGVAGTDDVTITVTPPGTSPPTSLANVNAPVITIEENQFDDEGTLVGDGTFNVIAKAKVTAAGTVPTAVDFQTSTSSTFGSPTTRTDSYPGNEAGARAVFEVDFGSDFGYETTVYIRARGRTSSLTGNWVTGTSRTTEDAPPPPWQE